VNTTHTIKIDVAKSIVVQPTKTGAAGVRFSLVLFGADMATAVLTPDQCAALILGIQIAGEQSGAGLRCQGDGCAAGQLPCPTPEFCGCAAKAAA
jgi:hypothetical protein